MLRPDVIITVLYAVLSSIAMLLMGMEVIHAGPVIDKLLITIPAGTAIIIGYWFAKNREGL